MGRKTNNTTAEPRGVVAVGASAGGVEALERFASGLPRDLPCAVLVALHMPRDAPSVLARIIDRSGLLSSAPAQHGEPLESGRIYVAVPDRHLLVADHRIILSDGPTENAHRPAINALFRSVALTHGARSVGVVLSGVLDDGVLGSVAIKSRGGTTIVQDPGDALFSAMPINAIQAGVADHRAVAADIGGLLAKLVEREIEDHIMEPDAKLELENRIAMGRRFSTSFDTEALGPPSGYVCPDCNGSLQQISDDNYRCQVGHAWTAEALLQARDHEVEGALWVAVRSLQEKSKLARRMADNIGSGNLFMRYQAIADEAEHAVTVLGNRLSEAYRDAGERGAS
ncbi:MAG: chemotaxis protein CheB [Mycobacteriaceae bacterium]|nr:chemotaxis protein CheB [Mycobacteriaceae bacterium]